MIRDCLHAFEQKYNEFGDRLILDHYVPVDGTYLVVGPDGRLEDPIEVKMDKRTKAVQRDHPGFFDICYYDYHSKLIEMNKAVDQKKIIHSNNYLSFYIKKENLMNGKLTNQVIDDYYARLAEPLLKYKDKQSKALYLSVENNIGQVDKTSLEQCRGWIRQHIFNLGAAFDLTGKNYLKLFFRQDKKVFQREGLRYLLPNIYNSNNNNREYESKIMGVTNDNFGLNEKKPFLAAKTRKIDDPYLITLDEAILQKKFFDLLMTFASSGKLNIFIDAQNGNFFGCKNGEFPPGNFSYGMFLRLEKGKTETEIHHQDMIIDGQSSLRSPFAYDNILSAEHKGHDEWLAEYHVYTQRKELQLLLDDIFFSKHLTNHYFTKPEEIKTSPRFIKVAILLSREAIFNWIYKGMENRARDILNKITLNLIKAYISNGYMQKAIRQFNLRWSIISYFDKGGGLNMGQEIRDIIKQLKKKTQQTQTDRLNSDREYYFAIGQLAYYFVSLSKQRDKSYDMLGPFYNANSDEIIKKRLEQLHKKYSHGIWLSDIRTRNIFAMILEYTPEGDVDQDMIIAGSLHSNLIYYKEDAK